MAAPAGCRRGGTQRPREPRSILRVLRLGAPRASLEELQPGVPVVPVCCNTAARALHPRALHHRVAGDGAGLVPCPVRVHQGGRIHLLAGLLAHPQVHLLLDVRVHGPGQDFVADLFRLSGPNVRLLGQLQVARVRNVRIFEIHVVDSCVVRILDGIRDVQEPVKEEECHVDHVRVLAIHASLVERLVARQLGAVAAKRHAGLRDELGALASLLQSGPVAEEVR
mmetsp:Transcript_43980/g.116698  ORF Transcript_43980/g.116698 Transcript_43980/m.116698 type:complete len:224 (+) Transcript_43980:89-760(+)